MRLVPACLQCHWLLPNSSRACLYLNLHACLQIDHALLTAGWWHSLHTLDRAGASPPLTSNALYLFLPATLCPAGSCASRRLAARLIPRFVAKFPSRADTAAALLIDLHEGRTGANRRRSVGGAPSSAAPPVNIDPLSVPALEEATRHDALSGLGAVLQAVTGLDVARADACVARILDYLTR